MTTAEADPEIYESHGAASGSVTGGVAAILRLEGGAALVLALVAYHALGGAWWLFAVLFFVPDLSMLGYFVNTRVGAFTYNAGHSHLSPAALALAGFLLQRDVLYLLAAIWFAHIGFDRLLGYGLKYPWAFGATHLSQKGAKRPRNEPARGRILQPPAPARQ